MAVFFFASGLCGQFFEKKVFSYGLRECLYHFQVSIVFHLFRGRETDGKTRIYTNEKNNIPYQLLASRGSVKRGVLAIFLAILDLHVFMPI